MLQRNVSFDIPFIDEVSKYAVNFISINISLTHEMKSYTEGLKYKDDINIETQKKNKMFISYRSK